MAATWNVILRLASLCAMAYGAKLSRSDAGIPNEARALRRIKIDWQKMNKSMGEDSIVSAQPIDDSNLWQWEGKLKGPDGSPYAGGVFKVSIRFPGEYPMKPPKVEFLTRVWHPNIADVAKVWSPMSPKPGEICLDILKDGDWSPVQTIYSVLTSLVSLLAEPNSDDPLNAAAGHQALEDPEKFKKTAVQYTKDYATETWG
uniref:UBC core domain-containing protein n=1 Tax=Zooxanthella nutricula TaxID=1333877 RepID=A0A7S2MI25_9DINO|mmetsp:Transcript_101415/g.310123  ORF Transcript_101415/g.310123 Transcript_101415/m.310123 type:complete len:201 (+) Transcript_101415:323-925(+)